MKTAAAIREELQSLDKMINHPQLASSEVYACKQVADALSWVLGINDVQSASRVFQDIIALRSDERLTPQQWNARQS